jgi:hypothetical protein
MSTISTTTRRLAAPAVLAAALIGAGCNREAQPVSTTKVDPVAAVTPTTQQTTAPKPARWPFVGEPTAPSSSTTFDGAVMMRRNYYVVFDASGSMEQSRCSGNESKIVVAQRALGAFIERLPADVNLGLTVFDNDGIRELIKLQPLNKDGAARTIASIRAGGGTPLAASIRMAYAALTEQGRTQGGYGEFHLVVVTDGEATGENPANVVNAMLKESPVVLHTIGFCIGNDHSLNQKGRVVYRAADNPSELAAGLANVLAEAPAFTVQSFK